MSAGRRKLEMAQQSPQQFYRESAARRSVFGLGHILDFLSLCLGDMGILAKAIRGFLEGDHQFCYSDQKSEWSDAGGWDSAISDRNGQEKNMESEYFSECDHLFCDSDQRSERSDVGARENRRAAAAAQRSHAERSGAEAVLASGGAKHFSAPVCRFGFSASNLRAFLFGARCERADRGSRPPRWDRRSARATC